MPLRFKNEDLVHLETAFDSYPATAKKSEGQCIFYRGGRSHEQKFMRLHGRFVN